MSQTELLAWSEPDTKFFADNLLGVEDWGKFVAHVCRPVESRTLTYYVTTNLLLVVLFQINSLWFLGDSIADVKFNPDDLFLGGEDQDLDLEVSALNLQKFSIAL